MLDEKTLGAWLLLVMRELGWWNASRTGRMPLMELLTMHLGEEDVHFSDIERIVADHECLSCPKGRRPQILTLVDGRS